jgi:glycosyltransferase involved in cell wall biosynthesis
MTPCDELAPADKESSELKNGRARAKILEIGPYPPPYAGWALRIFFVKKALEQSDHVCVPMNLGVNRRVPSSEYECVRSGWEYFLKLAKYAMRGFLFHIHINAQSKKGLILAAVAMLTTLACGRRPVLTFHAGTVQKYFPRQNSAAMAPILRTMFGVSSQIICNDVAVKRRIEQYGIKPQRVHPIPAFSIQYLDGSSISLPREIEQFFDRHPVVLLTYVELRPEYALESLIEALAAVVLEDRGTGVILVGASDEGPELGEMLRRAGLGNQAIHVGSVDHATFLALVRRSATYVRSARTEGSSSSIRESLCLGTPVVANASESHPPGVITYSWGNAESLASTLRNMLDRIHDVKRSIPHIEINDTVQQEGDLLVDSYFRPSVEKIDPLVRC